MHAEPGPEFEQLKALLGRYVRTPLGRAELDKVAPGSDRAEIEAALADAAEAMEHSRARSMPQPAFTGRCDSSALRARRGSRDRRGAATHRGRDSFEPTEIFELTRLLDLAGETRSTG